MSFAKMKCPLNIGSLSIQGHTYTPDEEGYITPVVGDHIADLERHGVKVPLVEDMRPDVVISVGGETVDVGALTAELDTLRDQNAALAANNRQLLDDLETAKEDNAAVREVNDGLRAALEGISGAGEDTLGGEDTLMGEDTLEGADRREDPLSWDRPDADSSRDELVDWLRAREIGVSPAISKDAAWAAVDDAIAANKLAD